MVYIGLSRYTDETIKKSNKHKTNRCCSGGYFMFEENVSL